jgi:hypothetical protein
MLYFSFSAGIVYAAFNQEGTTTIKSLFGDSGASLIN